MLHADVDGRWVVILEEKDFDHWEARKGKRIDVLMIPRRLKSRWNFDELLYQCLRPCVYWMTDEENEIIWMDD